MYISRYFIVLVTPTSQYWTIHSRGTDMGVDDEVATINIPVYVDVYHTMVCAAVDATACDHTIGVLPSTQSYPTMPYYTLPCHTIPYYECVAVDVTIPYHAIRFPVHVRYMP